MSRRLGTRNAESDEAVVDPAAVDHRLAIAEKTAASGVVSIRQR